MKHGKNIQLDYQLLCEDVRLEIGNKLSFMGIFHDIFVQQLPITLHKVAVVNHWRGNGQFLSEVRILHPGKQQVVAVSTPTAFEVPPGGFADNITFFLNLTFDRPGEYVVQTLIDSTLFTEKRMTVGIVNVQSESSDSSENELLN